MITNVCLTWLPPKTCLLVRQPKKLAFSWWMTRKNSVSKLTSFWFFFLFFTFLSSFIMSLRKRKMSCCHPLQQYGEENRVIFKLILIKLMTLWWSFGLHWVKKHTFLKILSEKHFLCLHRQLSTQDRKHFRSNKRHTPRNSWTEYNSCGRWRYHVSSD